MKPKIIIDTDPGHDDALAIMLAVKSDLFDIKAITTVVGNSTIENVTRNARYVMKLLDSDKIPIYSGCSSPLNRDNISAVVHGKSGLAGIDPEIEPNLTNNGVDKIISIVYNNPSEITLVCLGPLTNVASAIIKNPEVMKKVKELVIMGGAIKIPGNKNRVAEFNIFVDPEAADIVFKFPVKKTIIPLDVCNDIRLSFSDFKRINNEKIRKPVLAMMEKYIFNINELEGINAALMYDPLTVYFLMNPSACKTSLYDIVIETKGEYTSGMTVADLRFKGKKDSKIYVVEQIIESQFIKDFIETLSRE